MSAGAVVLAFVSVGGVASAQRHGGGGQGRGNQPQPQGSSQGAPQPLPGQGTPGGGGTVTGRPGAYHVQPLNLHKEALGTVALAAEARARMRNGDCAGALDLFDQALVSSTDPTLYRDRGLCHERLGDPYPAIDDFRQYLSDSPDAADAEDIRARLARLEMDVYHHSSEATDAPPAETGPTPREIAEANVAADTGGGPKRDELEEVEHDHDEMQSSLRAGRGISLAPFFAEHKWIVPNTSFGDSSTWSESVGLQMRYSFASQSALVLEAGYESFNATGGNISGLTSQVAYEERVPLDPGYDNQLLLGAGIGFEYLVFGSQDAAFSSASTWGFIPRVRFGWRHMLTASVGFDLTLDGGVSVKALSQNTGFIGGDQASELVALNIGLAWGL